MEPGAGGRERLLGGEYPQLPPAELQRVVVLSYCLILLTGPLHSSFRPRVVKAPHCRESLSVLPSLSPFFNPVQTFANSPLVHLRPSPLWTASSVSPGPWGYAGPRSVAPGRQHLVSCALPASHTGGNHPPAWPVLTALSSDQTDLGVSPSPTLSSCMTLSKSPRPLNLMLSHPH